MIAACAPTDSADVVNVALPVLSSVPLPIVVAPSLKATAPPVNVPAAGAVIATVAVNVTGCPTATEAPEEATVVVVLPLFTVCKKLAEVEVAKLVSPA